MSRKSQMTKRTLNENSRLENKPKAAGKQAGQSPESELRLLQKQVGNRTLVQRVLFPRLGDENKLTNQIFHARHPERGGRSVNPQSERSLALEWKKIRDDQVRPALAQANQANTKQQAKEVPGEATSASRLSGPHWVNRYPTSRSTDTLIEPFKGNVESFIKMLHANRAQVEISATYRPPERAYLMHFAWFIAHGLIKYGEYPIDDPYGININWDHGTEEASRTAAREMVAAYRMAHPAVLKSRHTEGRAIDMTITNLPTTLRLDDRAIEIGSEPAESNRALWSVAAKYFSVHKLAKDRPHWSEDGR